MRLTGFVSNWRVVLLLGLGIAIGSGRALAQRALGIDVSTIQSNIDWASVKSAGITFAWAKATEGYGYTDSFYTYNAINAKAAGVLIGAYHYARPDLNVGTAGADTEADYFWSVTQNYIKYGGYYLVPMLDFEQSVTSVSPPYTTNSLSAWANEWCNRLVSDAAANGIAIKPVIYTFSSYVDGTGGYGPGVDSSVTQWPLWMANVNYTQAQAQTGAPSTTSPWSNWAFWQYNWYGTVSGISTNVDLDVFQGNAASLAAKYVVGVPYITTNPASIAIPLGSNATFSVSIAGPTPFTFKWKFNGATINGATTASYTVTNAQTTNAGGYSVQVTNSQGSAFSSIAFLSVFPPLTNAPGSIVAPANMLNWWAADGNPNDIFGTVNGTPHNGLSYAIGKSGLAFYFDGFTSYLSLSATNVAPPWTACLWVNRVNASGYSAAIIGDGYYALKLEQFSNPSNPTRYVGFTQYQLKDYTFPSKYIVPAGVWTHLAFVGKPTSVSLYVNGVLNSSVAVTNFPLPRTSIGSALGGLDLMQGSLDDLMLYSRALSAAEINSIYTADSASLVCGPQIMSANLNASGNFQMGLRGQTGKNYAIDYSTNLINWVSAGNLANTAGTNQYTDTTVTNNAPKFFRASQTY